MLADLLVIEYASCISGPYCTKLLADLGAEVIKIEDPVSGDEARRRGPFVEDNPDPEGSGLFLYLNSNKLGVTLDVGKPAGARVFRQLLREADVLVENRPHGRMKELGFAFQDVKPGGSKACCRIGRCQTKTFSDLFSPGRIVENDFFDLAGNTVRRSVRRARGAGCVKFIEDITNHRCGIFRENRHTRFWIFCLTYGMPTVNGMSVSVFNVIRLMP